jgi:hypothetical protein
MSDQKRPQTNPDELSAEELNALYAEELPRREALSVLRFPWLTAGPIEAAPDSTDLAEE